MLVKREGRAVEFKTILQFKTTLNFKSEEFYDFSFQYLLNYDKCDRNIELKMLLRDEDLFAEVLFDSSHDIEFDKYSNSKWNGFSDCFQVFGRNYILVVDATSNCEITNHGAFIAVDEIYFALTNQDDPEDKCKDFRTTRQTSTLITTTKTLETLGNIK
jgi:hypothetical protein